jgi:hypothetical protein
VLDQELAVHDRDPPVAPLPDLLRDLVAVAEEAERLAQRCSGVAALDPGEAGGRRAGEHALPHPGDELAPEVRVRHREQEDGGAGPPVRRLAGREDALDPGLAAAGDHRRGEAGHRLRRGHRPGGLVRGDHDPRRPHRERLGEGVLDQDAVQDQRARLPALAR